MATQMQAADVDLAAAKNVAKSFMTSQVANGRLKAADVNNLQLIKAEASVFNPKAVDYYIFNADKSYVVVAGDDQAPEILMYGVSGKLDMGKIPPAMQWLLNKYKYQIDGLKAGTLKPNGYTPKATTAVAPLTNANWDQGEPYWNHTPTSGGTHTYTGCPATSLSMCFYIYKWPTTYPALPTVQVSGGVTASALSEKAADWDNIIDEYTGPTNYSYTTAQAEAVSWLMRYVGQACNMQYTTSGSGAYDPDILEACHTFGYTDAQLLTLTTGYAGYNQNYTDAQWNEWMLAELHAGRPIEYLASDPSAGGHAFNVFGCDSSGKYYVNWGWSGEDNGYCTLHNFTTGNNSTGQGGGSYTFNYGEAMIIGIAPPAGALGPNITVNPTSLEFEGYVGDTYTKTFTVTGASLEGDITISKQGSIDITVSPTTITAANAANGVEVTVTYKPTNAGNASAVLTLSSEGADDVTLNVTGVAQAKVPTINVDPASLSFNAKLSTTVTKTINVTGLFLTNNITVTLNDNNGVFSVTPTTITAAEAANGVPVTVSFSSENEGNYTGSLTIASNGAETKTVALSANANDGGTASDAYLDIAKYATIDDAGATVSGMSSIYKYTEYADDACAWLTVSNYGALQVDANQNWLNCEGTAKIDSETWAAADIFPGSSNYFTGNAFYVNWNESNNNFYVTNCTQVKQYAKNLSSTNYYLYMRIYECTVNADGSVTASTTAFDTQRNTTSSPEVLTSKELDPSKVYKVEVYNDYAHLYEIGFKTDLEVPMLKANPTEIAFQAKSGETKTATIAVNGKLLPGDVSVALTDPSEVFTVSATTISKSAAEAGANLTVTFTSDVEGGFTGAVTLTSGDLTATVDLSAVCSNGGSASDKYLDIAKYMTIDAAGATVSGMQKIYNYTENGNNGWLTVSNYGAQKTDATQEWIVNSLSQTAAQTWTANDVFQGDDYYFGEAQSYASDWNGYYQRFYVTNCTQVKQYAYNRSSSYPLYLRVYECVENADGSLTASSTAFDTQKSSVYSSTEILTSAELDASKIYMVELYNDYSYLFEIAFRTPLEVVEEGNTLAEILATGVNGNEYTVSNDLAVADVADVENYAFLTDGEGNWIRVAASNELISVFVDNATIKGGTLKGTLSDVELNPVLTATAAEGGSNAVDFNIDAINIADSFSFISNQVVDVTGYWNAAENTLRAYSPGNGAQGKSLSIDYTWGATSNTLENGKRYTVRCAINLKEAWHTPAGIMPKDYDYDFQNYIGYALRMPDAPTAIGTIALDSYNEIVNVYNAQGQLIRSNVKAGEATRNLPRGIYIVGNKKVVVE